MVGNALSKDSGNDLKFERVTGSVGATVHGLDLRREYPTATAAALCNALHEYGVLFFEFGEALSASEFTAFGTLFGEPEGGYGLAVDKSPNGYIDSDVVPMKEVRINVWHSDGSALAHPPQTAMLTPVELPEAGGDTMWASMYAAWEGLSSYNQRLLEDLQVVHGTSRSPFLKQPSSAIHPAMIRDPVTHRKMLYVNPNYSERVVGMSESESSALLRMLFEHVNTPEFHVRLRWQLGVVAVFDERVTQHRGVADFTGPRKLRRMTFAGAPPSA